MRNVFIAALASAAAISLAIACGGSTQNSGSPDASTSSGSGSSSGGGSGGGSGGSSGAGSGSSSGGDDGGGAGDDGGPVTGCADFNACPGNNICCTVAGTTGAGTQTLCTSSDASSPSCPAGTQQVCSGANTNNTCSPGGNVMLGPCNFSCTPISGSTFSVCVPMTGVNCDAGSSGSSDAGMGDDGAAADTGTPPQDAASQ
jgi:hypothetical protein